MLKIKLLLLITLLSIVFQSDGQGCNAVDQKHICLNPKIDKDFSAQWVQDNGPPKGWYMLLGNPIARLHWAQLLQGKTLNATDDFTKLCAKTLLDNTEDEIGGDYKGYDHLRATRKCSVVDLDISCTAVSKTNPNYTLTYSGYVAYVDKRNFRSFHIGVVCYDNGDIGWLLSSIKKSLTDEDLETVKEQLKRIGFDPEDRVTLYDQSCED